MKKTLLVHSKRTLSKGATVLLAAAFLVASFGALTLMPNVSQVAAKSDNKKYSDTILELKFIDSSNIEARGNKFVGDGADAVNDLLGKVKFRKTAQLFSQDRASLKQLNRELRGQGKDVADLSQYYMVTISADQDIEAVAAELRALEVVEHAYPQPLPAKSPVTPNWEGVVYQRLAAPRGVDAADMVNWPGAKGSKVQVVDMEYSWNMNHEDISKARATGAFIQVGTYQDPYPDDNKSHGTGVIGVLSADHNGIGVAGIVPDARLRMINAYNTDGYNPANVINVARQNMVAGDVLLIEQQTGGPEETSGAPLEWYASVYDAIKTATAANINVVEAAGNGNKNLNNTAVFGSSFPSGKSDSGAIIVGAAYSCGGTTDPLLNARMPYSTYGTRVNLFAAGECVVTTTGPNASNFYNNGVNEMYGYFTGTSSASAVVAGAVAAYTSAYKQLNGTAPTAASVRSTLASTGTAQNLTAPGALTGNIGKMPSLKNALLKTDLKAPTATLTTSTANAKIGRSVTLTANASDNVGVTKVEFYRGTTKLGEDTSAPYTYAWNTAGLAANNHSLTVKAYDAAGKVTTSSAKTVRLFDYSYTTNSTGVNMSFYAPPISNQNVRLTVSPYPFSDPRSNTNYNYDYNYTNASGYVALSLVNELTRNTKYYFKITINGTQVETGEFMTAL